MTAGSFCYQKFMRFHHFIRQKIVIRCKSLVGPLIEKAGPTIIFKFPIFGLIKFTWVWRPFIFNTFGILVENRLLFFDDIIIMLYFFDHSMQIRKVRSLLLAGHQRFYRAKFLWFYVHFLLILVFSVDVLIFQNWWILKVSFGEQHLIIL